MVECRRGRRRLCQTLDSDCKILFVKNEKEIVEMKIIGAAIIGVGVLSWAFSLMDSEAAKVVGAVGIIIIILDS